jgi:transcriptional regulator with XRE-family HTH domain
MSENLQSALGRNLRMHREKLGLSQEKYGEQLGYHRTYIGSLERGERNVSLRSLETLAALMGVDPRDLLRE